MNKRIAAYVFLLIGICILTVAYTQTEPAGILALLLVVLLFLLLSLPVLWLGVKVGNISVSEAGAVGKPILFQIKLKNKGVFPVFRAEIVLRVIYTATGQRLKKRLTVALMPRETLELQVPVIFDYCGQVKLEASAVKIYDWLGLFCMWHKGTEASTLMILPDYGEIYIRNREAFMNDVSNSDRYHATKSGEDPSEVFDVRPFRPGDKLQKVHWKLSTRTDEILVKEYASPISYRVCLLIDMNVDSYQEYNRRMVTCLSLAVSLLEADCVFLLLWYQPQQNVGVMKHKVLDMESLYEAFSVMLMNSKAAETDPLEILSDARFEDRLKQLIYITGTEKTEQCKRLLQEKQYWADALYIFSVAASEKECPVEQQCLGQDYIYRLNSRNLKEQLKQLEISVL